MADAGRVDRHRPTAYRLDRRIRWPVAAALVALAAVVAACSGEAEGTIGPGGTDRPTDQPLATTPQDPTLAAAIGPWRRNPFKADPAFGAPFEAGCRSAEPAIGAIPRVVLDVRGNGWITLLFADDANAFLCRATLDDPGHPLEVRHIDVPTATLADNGIDLALWTQVDIPPDTYTFAVGRVGPVPADVIGGFVNETFVFATHTNGWWVAWWPPQPKCDGFSAVDGGHLVMGNVKAPPGGEYPAPS
jgi:hypothetical protein